MMRKECKLIQELFPLYAENLVSEETAEYIKGHLAECGCCAGQWARLNQPLVDPLPEKEMAPENRIGEKLFSRLKKTVLVALLFLTLGGVSLVYASYNAGKHVGSDDPSYRLAEELGLFTQINQTKTLSGIQVTIDKGLFDSSRTVLFLRFSSPGKTFPQVSLSDEDHHEYLQKSGKGWQNKYFILEFEPFKLEAQEARVSLSFTGDAPEKIEFSFPVDVTKIARHTRIVYPSQEKNLPGVKIALEKAVFGVSESEFKLKLDWPVDGSVAGIALGRGTAFFPTSVTKVPPNAPPPPGLGPLPPGGLMSNYAATYGINYRAEDPPANRPALYDLTKRQEVTVQKAEFKTTQFPCQVVVSLKFAPIRQETTQLELLLPPVYVYEKIKGKKEIGLDLSKQGVISLEKSLSYPGGRVIIEKAWLEKDRVHVSYRLESPDSPDAYLPQFTLKDEKGMNQGSPRFDRENPQVVIFSLLNKDTKEVFLSLDSIGRLLPREKFAIDMGDK